MITSERPLFVYLQRPDNGEWVVAGRYLPDAHAGSGSFRYAPSYVEAGLSWAIDPVNLPFVPGVDYPARRYDGLHDVLRDASPDSWGQMLIRREHQLGIHATAIDFLCLSGNSDRWGALAVGESRKPHVAKLASPRLHRLDALVQEVLAIAQAKPAIDGLLRKRLFATPSMGGARPKATVQDGDDYWLVKPGLMTDTVDLALLEHATMQWGRRAGLRFADTRHHPLGIGRSVLRILRFDRRGAQRIMTVSAASLLQVQYPPVEAADSSGASYPRLAEELKRIGALPEDGIELFGRMVFNGVVGNNDDHPRNHAVLFDLDQQRWRLSPAFDVVPDTQDDPGVLVMQVSAGRHDITREAMLQDYLRFGFATHADASDHFDALLKRIEDGYADIAPLLDAALRASMQQRLQTMLAKLSVAPVVR